MTFHKHLNINTRDLYRLNIILVRLYNAAASPASRLRSFFFSILLVRTPKFFSSLLKINGRHLK